MTPPKSMAVQSELLTRLLNREDMFTVWEDMINPSWRETEPEDYLPPRLARINAMILRVVHWNAPLP